MLERFAQWLSIRNNDSPLSKSLIFVKLSAIVIIVIMLVISAVSLLEYSEMLEQREDLQNQIQDAQDTVDELKYLIDAPMNRDYIIRVAREKLGLVLPEEIIYYSEPSK